MMSATVIAAVVGGSISLAVAVIGQIFTPLANIRLEHQKAEFQSQLEAIKASLQDEGGQKSARRDYEYEARKRLYGEIEPLLFQLYESAKEFNYRIASLARTYRNGHLDRAAESWLDDDSYYLKSTAYKWIHPTLIYRLFQSRLTFIDLKLDNIIRLRYLLLRSLVFSFTDAYEFADGEPKLRYSPDWERIDFPAEDRSVFHPQGLVLGDLENMMDELTTSGDKPRRIPFFNEFERLIQTGGDQSSAIENVLAIFRGSSPDTDPVLMRMLCAQAMICHLLQRSYCGAESTVRLREELETVLGKDPAPDWLLWGMAQNPAIEVARKYANNCLNWIDEQP
jgi:hypothetical protein